MCTWRCTCVRRVCITESLTILRVEFVILFNYTCMSRRAGCVLRVYARPKSPIRVPSAARFDILECEFVRCGWSPSSTRETISEQEYAPKIENGVISMEILIIRNSTSSDHSARRYDSASARYRGISEESSGLATRSTKFHANFHDRSRACSILFRSIHIVAIVHGDRSSVSPAICVTEVTPVSIVDCNLSSLPEALPSDKRCPPNDIRTDGFVSPMRNRVRVRAHPRACIHT